MGRCVGGGWWGWVHGWVCVLFEPEILNEAILYLHVQQEFHISILAPNKSGHFMKSSQIAPLPQRCDSCRDPGATVGCCCSHCTANYHFQCAREAGCLFLSNKEVFCQQHAAMAPLEVSPTAVSTGFPIP